MTEEENNQQGSGNPENMLGDDLSNPSNLDQVEETTQEQTPEAESDERPGIGSEVRRQIERITSGVGDPAELARNRIDIPNLRDGYEERQFTLSISRVGLRAGNRYEGITGQPDAYTDVPEFYRTFRSPSTSGNITITGSRTLQVRGINAIDAINYGGMQIQRQTTGVSPRSAYENQLGAFGSAYLHTERMISRLSGVTDIPLPSRGIPGVRQTPVMVDTSSVNRTLNKLSFSSAEQKADSGKLQELVTKLEQLKKSLGSNVITSIDVNYRSGIRPGDSDKPVSVTVKVRNFNDQFDRMGLFTSNTKPTVERHHSFTLTTDRAGNVIEVGSNRFIGGAAFSRAQSTSYSRNNLGGISFGEIFAGSRIGGQLVTDGIDTAISYIATYARSTFVEARVGALNQAFNAMVDQGDLTALGRVLGEALLTRVRQIDGRYGMTFGHVIEERIKEGIRGQTFREDIETMINDISAIPDSLLNDSLIKGEFNRVLADHNLTPEIFEAVLFNQRRLSIREAFNPVLSLAESRNPGELVREKTKQTLEALFHIMSAPKTVELRPGVRLQMDLFYNLKQAAVAASPYGSTYYAFTKQGISKTILGILQSPFLQPHETGFSAGMLQARLGLYANPDASGPRNFYDLLNAAGTPYLDPSTFRHGDIATSPGFAFRPLASLASPKNTSRRMLMFQEVGSGDGGMENVSTFYQNEILMTSTPQLAKTSLKRLKQAMVQAGYSDIAAVMRSLKESLNLARMSDKEAENQDIFVLPFKKPEQIVQRLKNIVGARNAYEVEVGFYTAIRRQKSLGQFYKVNEETQQDQLDVGRVMAGQLNVTLPEMQFGMLQQRYLELKNKYTLDGRFDRESFLAELTTYFREIEANPHSGIRGFIGGRNLRRVLVGMGLNQLSDFMYLNAGYKAAFGYTQVTNVRLSELQVINGKTDFIEDFSIEQKRAILDRAFTPRSRLYYTPQQLESVPTLNILNEFYQAEYEKAFKLVSSKFDLEQKLREVMKPRGAKPSKNETAEEKLARETAEQKILLRNIDRVLQRQAEIDAIAANEARRVLEKAFPFLDSFSLETTSEKVKSAALGREIDVMRRQIKGATLKAGLYEVMDDGVVRNLGRFDHSQLILGISGSVLEEDTVKGGLTARTNSATLFKIKMPGLIRAEQGGVAVPVMAPVYSPGSGASVNAQLTLQVVFGPSQVRPGSPGVKGPGLFINEAGFSLVDDLYAGQGFFSNSVMADTAYALMASTSLKGYNYESGLDALRDEGSFRRLTNLSADDYLKRLGVLLAGGKSQEAQQFRSALADYFEGSDRRTARMLRYSGSKAGFNLDSAKDFKGIGLVAAAPGLVMLAGQEKYKAETNVDGRLLVFRQIRQRLLKATQSAEAREKFKVDVVRLLEKARREDAFILGAAFNEADPFVRAASIIADTMLTLEQGDVYEQAARARGINNLPGMLELSRYIVDPLSGRVNVGSALRGQFALGIRDLLQRTKLFSATDQEFDRMYRLYESSPEAAEKDSNIRRLKVSMMKLYVDSQLDPKIQKALNITPSRILTAVGSEDEVAMEFHYTLAYSTRMLQQLRGAVTSTKELSALQTAYNFLLTTGDSPYRFRKMNLVNPMGGPKSLMSQLTKVQQYLDAATPLSDELPFLGDNGLRTLSNQFANDLVQDSNLYERTANLMAAIKRSITADYGGYTMDLERRAQNLATLLDPRRLSRYGNRLGGGTSPVPEIRPSTLVFFDTETLDFVDNRYVAGDARRYSKRLAEIAYKVVSKNQSLDGLSGSNYVYDGGTIPDWAKHKYPEGLAKEGIDHRKAIENFLGFVRNVAEKAGGADNIALAGHNIRSFDLPSLQAQMYKLGMAEEDIDFLRSLKTFDTRYELNKQVVSEKLGISRVSMEKLSEQLDRLDLIKEIDSKIKAGDADVDELIGRLRSGQYRQTQSHKALADVDLNIRLYKALDQMGGFRAQFEDLSTSSDFKVDLIRLFDTQFGDDSKITGDVKKNALREIMSRSTTGRPFIYYGSSNEDRARFRYQVAEYLSNLQRKLRLTGNVEGRAVVSARPLVAAVASLTEEEIKQGNFEYKDTALVKEHLLHAAKLVADRTGVARDRSGRIYSSGEVYNRVLGATVKSDENVKKLIEKSMNVDPDSFVNSLETFYNSIKTELEGLNVRRQQMLAQGVDPNSEDYQRIEDTIRRFRNYERLTGTSQMLLLPQVETYQDDRGKRILRFYNPRQVTNFGDIQEAAQFGTFAAPILGVDVLRALPKSFEGFTNEIIASQAEIRSMLPEYRVIMENLAKEGRLEEVTEREVVVIQRMQQLAAEASYQIATAVGSTLKQRAYGEKVKYPGRSMIAVASYLVGIDEVAVGSASYRYLEGVKGAISRRSRATAGKVFYEGDKEARRLKSAALAISTDIGNPFAAAEAAILYDDRLLSALGFAEDSSVIQTQRRLRVMLEEDLARTDAEGRALKAALLKPGGFIKGGSDVTNLENIGALPETLRLRYAEYQNLISDRSYLDALQQIEASIRLNPKALSSTVQLPGEPAKDALLMKRAIREMDTISDYQSRLKLSNMELYDFAKAIVNRAGGPSAASSLTDQASILTSIKKLQVRGLGSFLELNEELNNTAAILPAYGRFGSQGGDFDGDSYQLLYGFDDLQRTLRQKRESAMDVERAIRNVRQGIRLVRNNLRSQQQEYKDQLKKGVTFSPTELEAIQSARAQEQEYIRLQKEELSYNIIQLRQLREEADRINESIVKLTEDRQAFGERVEAGARRQIAAYAGLPQELFSRDAQIFGFAETVNLVEQQRGIMPNLDDYGAERGFNQIELASFVDLAVQQESFDQLLRDRQSAFDGIDRLLASSQFELRDEERTLLATVLSEEADSFRPLLGDREALSMRIIEEISSPARSAAVLSGQIKMLQGAAGTSLNSRSFDVLNTVIGSTGTTLIGEGYNAITTLISQGMFARAVSETMGNLPTGLEPGDNSAGRLAIQMAYDNLEQLFPDDQLTEAQRAAKEELRAFSLVGEDADRTIRNVGRRSDLITGTLGMIQQILRDSLKPKEAGGLLRAISKLGPDGQSFEDKFLSITDDFERYDYLREFISVGAGASLVRPVSGSDYNINAFGAILLLSDYVRTAPENETQFLRMVGAISGDNQGQYAFLKTRRQELASEAEQLEGRLKQTNAETQEYGQLKQRYNEVTELLQSPRRLVEQTILDLINQTTSEKMADTMFGQDRESVDQVRRIRKSLQEAIVDDRTFATYSEEDQKRLREIRQTLSDSDAYREDVQRIFALDDEKFTISDDKQAKAMMRDLGLSFRQNFGLTTDDLATMRSIVTAEEYLKQQTGEVAEVFGDFLASRKENLMAYNILSARDKLNDVPSVRALQLQMGESYTQAMSQVADRLEKEYGSLANAFSKAEVMRGFSAMGQISGLFGKGLSQEAEQMLALSLSKKGAEGRSALEMLSDRFAGLRIFEETQERLLRTRQQGGLVRQADLEEYNRMQEAYQAALQKDAEYRESLAPGANLATDLMRNNERNRFYERIGRERAQRAAENDERVRRQTANLDEAERLKQRNALASAIGLLAGPLVVAGASTDFTFDENVAARTYDVAQAAAQMRDNSAARAGARGFRISAASAFMADRIRQQIYTEQSVLMGAAKGAAFEALFMGASMGISSIFNAQRARSRGGAAAMTVLAELGSTAFALGVGRTLSGKVYGPGREPAVDYIQRALAGLADQAALYIESMLEEPTVGVEGETEDGVVAFDVVPTAIPTDFDVRVETGWLEIAYGDPDAEIVESNEEIMEANAPIAS